MTHSQILAALAEKLGSFEAVAKELDVSRQTVWNWRQIGIFKPFKRAVADLASEHGIRVPANFLPKRKSNGKAQKHK